MPTVILVGNCGHLLFCDWQNPTSPTVKAVEFECCDCRKEPGCYCDCINSAHKGPREE